jgi:hypothetical protein
VAPNNPCGVSAEAASTGLADWAPLLNFRPPDSVKSQMKARFTSIRRDGYTDFGYQPVDKGFGPCNMDCYMVDIITPPANLEDGTPFTAAGFLQAVRVKLNDYFDHREVWFEPYEDKDGPVFLSSSPLGAVMHFYMGGKTSDPGQHIADAGVVCTEFASDHWIFSTLQIPLMTAMPSTVLSNGIHPVNGNRMFGVGVRKAGVALSEKYQGKIPVRNQDTPYFYTRGIDRCSTLAMRAMSDSVFTGGHCCWMGLMKKVAKKLEDLGGTIEFAGEWVSARYDWDDIVTKPENKLWNDPPV